MSFFKNLILSLPVVKKEIAFIQTEHNAKIDRMSNLSAAEKTDLKTSLTNKDAVMNRYMAIKDKNLILDSRVVRVRKNGRYNIILVKTVFGDFRINVGRHAESGIGLGEHEMHHEKVKI